MVIEAPVDLVAEDPGPDGAGHGQEPLHQGAVDEASGWLASRAPGLTEAVTIHRDYDTISVGMIDDHLAALALENRGAVLERSHRITRVNRSLLAGWVEREPLMDWTPPVSGTTALLRLGLAVPSWDFCVRLVETTGVMLTPGSALGVEGSLRIGYGCATSTLAKGLGLLTGFLRSLEAEGAGWAP